LTDGCERTFAARGQVIREVEQFRAFVGRAIGFIVGLAFAVALLALLIALVRFFWVAASSPQTVVDIVQKLLEATWLQAIATILTAVATIALWVVTGRLRRVTSVQVHAQTAPLIAAIAYLVTDPVDPAAAFPLSPYEFEAEDASIVELTAYHRQFDQRMVDYDVEVLMAESAGNDPPDPPRKLYLSVYVANGQGQSSYGLATDVEVTVVLNFPRFSTVQGTTPTTVYQPDQWYEVPRTLKVPVLFGQGTVAIAAFRVDQIPYWTFTIPTVSHRNFRGRMGTFAVGTLAGAYEPIAGFRPQQGRWDPSPGEQPS
jgi:hypothetical protein